VINSMESISDITNRWAKISEFFFSNQEEEQKYVPPSKRSILPTPPPDQNPLHHPEPINIMQTTSLEAPPQSQLNKDFQKADQQQPRRSSNSHKLSFPEYNGNDEPSQWLYKCNKFFAARNTKEEERMQLVAFHLHGNALTWFIRWEQEIGHPTWPQFSQAIDRRFGPPIHHNHLGDLTSTH